MSTEAQQGKFEGWAVVEMMGHRREIGFVTTEVFGSACLFRVDTPALPDRECELKRPEWLLAQDGNHKHCPPGTKVKRAAVPAKTCLVGPPSIYAITPCTEEAALAAIEALINRPVILLSLPKDEALMIEGTRSPFQPSDADPECCEECGATPAVGHEDSWSFAAWGSSHAEDGK